MRGIRVGAVALGLISLVVAGCGNSSPIPDVGQVLACQTNTTDLQLPSQPTTAFSSVPQLAGQSLSIDGSTALYPLFQVAGQAFDAANQTHTSVQQGGSVTGLHDVESGKVQIGMSDIFFQDDATTTSDTDLVDHRVAAVAFTMAVNADLKTTVRNLTIPQLQDIYNGTLINWHQLGGPNELITVVQRPTTSGTRATFEKYVLGGPPSGGANEQRITKDSSDLVAQAIASTPGAIGYVATGYLLNSAYTNSLIPLCINRAAPTVTSINAGNYPFWNFEHAYTKGPPTPVEQAFLDAVTSTGFQTSTAPAKGFLQISQLSQTALNTHPLPAGAS